MEPRCCTRTPRPSYTSARRARASGSAPSSFRYRWSRSRPRRMSPPCHWSRRSSPSQSGTLIPAEVSNDAFGDGPKLVGHEVRRVLAAGEMQDGDRVQIRKTIPRADLGNRPAAQRTLHHRQMEVLPTQGMTGKGVSLPPVPSRGAWSLRLGKEPLRGLWIALVSTRLAINVVSSAEMCAETG
jgi:hypothetical protein